MNVFKRERQAIHFADRELTEAVNPILVNLIGIGGTGSHVLASLADMHEVLLGLRHPGLIVRAFDEDSVSPTNLGRQRFARSEVGMPKAAASINRINRFYGTYWQAVLHPYSPLYESDLREYLAAHITISCVDTVKARFEIEQILTNFLATQKLENARDKPLYWMDFGNSRETGQVFLSTLSEIPQPASKKFIPVAKLPFFTQEYRSILQKVDDSIEPSCSMREAISRQDLFINSTLAKLGCRLLWGLFTQGMIRYRGVFLNLADFKTAAIPIQPDPGSVQSLAEAA